MKYRLLIFAVLVLGRALSPVSAHAAPSYRSPLASPEIVSLAKQWFHRFQFGEIDRSQLNEVTNRELTDSMIRQESSRLKIYGVPLHFTYLGSEQIKNSTGYVFMITFHHGRVIEHIALDDEGKIAGIDFQHLG